MTSREGAGELGRASRLMRAAILDELRRPAEGEDTPPADKLHRVARALVDKAGQGDMTAIKEILDRIDGKSPAAAAEIDAAPGNVTFAWKQSPS
jgi:hypothetical protein